MKLLEHQAKSQFRQVGIECPMGRLAHTPAEAAAAARELGRVVVKAQVPIGGRGKAGGVKLAGTEQEARSAAEQILGMEIRGFRVPAVLCEEALDIARELYLGVALDRDRRSLVVMLSFAGGMEIEEVAAHHPEKILKVTIDPASGFSSFHARKLAYGLGLAPREIGAFGRFAQALYHAFVELDCGIIEINPLVVTGAGEVVALDAKISFDDNALFRHPDLEKLRDENEEDPKELEAARYSLNYVALDGTIGCMVNGAGLAMATMDIIKLYGAAPANFLDVGGGATKERVTAAFKIILSDPHVEGILVNIFGGIMRCDVIAEGVVAAAREVALSVPLVVRLEGTNVQLGKEILAKSGLPIIAADNLADAAEKVVNAVKEAA